MFCHSSNCFMAASHHSLCMQASQQDEVSLQLAHTEQQCRNLAHKAMPGLLEQLVSLHLQAVEAVVIAGIKTTSWHSPRPPPTWANAAG